MPTQVNPNDPNATGAGRLQSMVNGPRDPGTPSMAGKPGVQAGRYSFPAPPAPPAAPPGRPASPSPAPMGSRGAMGASPQPSQPGTAPAPGVGSPAASAPPTAATSPTPPGSPQPASGAGSSVSAGVAPPAPPTVDQNGQATQTVTSPTIPQQGTVMPGSAVQTPYGTVQTTPAGAQNLTLDANGAQRYKEAIANLRSKFTVPRVMKGMTGLPQMELKLGAPNFDPFSGKFYGKD